MSTVRVPVERLAEGERDLDRDTSHYFGVVLRLRAGDAFVAFDPLAAREADGRVLEAKRGRVRVALGTLREARVLARRRVGWVQGIAKGDKMDGIVRDATELGATLFVAAETELGVVRLDGPRGAARRARWQRVAQQAARQCGRGDPPEVEGPLPWREALARIDASDARFCLYERAETPIGPELLRALEAGSAVAFVAGPEGGLSEAEARAAAELGYRLVSLGPFVLRAETVATAVLGAVRLLDNPRSSR